MRSDARQWADALNARLGGKVTRRLPAVRSDADPRGADDPHALTAALERGEARELFILGGNPVYTGLPELALGGYAVYRHAYPTVFADGSMLLAFWIGTINTGVLLTSSLFVALGVHAIKGGLRGCLLAACALGFVFLALKGWEYFQKYEEHLVPGIDFHPGSDVSQPPQSQLFVFLYFAMTGLHALHMLVGLGALGWCSG